MIDYKTELKDILLSNHKKPSSFEKMDKDNIVLYGAGSLGEMAVTLLKTIDVVPKYIIDQKVKEYIGGIKIIHPKNIPNEDLDTKTFLITISSIAYQPIYKYLKEEIGVSDIRQFYDYAYMFLKDTLSNGWVKYSLSTKEIQEIESVCKSLEHDSNSIAHYLQFLWWKIQRVEKVYAPYPVLSQKKHLSAPCITKLKKDEIYLDGGACYGTTMQQFIEITDGSFKSIYAIEPDLYNIDILNKKIDKKYLQNTTLLNIVLSDKDEKLTFSNQLGFASKVNSKGNTTIFSHKIDSLNLKPTIIKLHLEGYELKALNGAKNTIKEHRPILIVLADHCEDGLFKIANFLMNLQDYKLYFYLHDYCGNSAIFYAIPNEKI